jgi:hypothetical protein
MIKLIIPTWGEPPEDVSRIIAVCTANGFEIDQETARKAWENYSDSMAAGWMGFPEEDDALLATVLRYTVQQPA